jgi:nucleoid DNA-binding protein
MEQTFEEYLKETKNVNSNRTHRITGSQNTISGFHYYRKIRPQEKEFVLKDKEYLSIIREMNNLVVDYLVENKSIRLPTGFGKLEIIKTETKSWIDDTGKFISSKKIDMNSTFKLWYEDEESRLNKTLVRHDDEFIFRIKYPQNGRMYKYNGYFSIRFNRQLRHKLMLAIKTGNYDTYLKPSRSAWLKQNGQI